MLYQCQSRRVLDADPRISQRDLSENGTEWVAREVQRELGISDALTPLQALPSLDLKTPFEADVQNCFPTIPRQKALDMVADQALPTHPSFRAALHLCHLLFGKSTRLTHHFSGREAEYVDFVDGLAQGCPSGPPLAMLTFRLDVHITSSKHPHLKVRILAIVDNLNLI